MIEKTYEFRGKQFKIACIEEPGFQHPSWYMYEDESSVRDSLWQITPNSCVFDIGAACGSYTVPALASGASKIFAWSPQEQTGLSSSGRPADGIPDSDFLIETLILNGWRDKVEVIRSGLYDKTGWLNTVTQEFTLEEPPYSGDVIRVETFDSWFEDRNILEYSEVWLKIDVEGAEVEVLKGAENFIRNNKPVVFVENHIFKRASLEQEVRDFLIPIGYKEITSTPYHGVSHSLYRPK